MLFTVEGEHLVTIGPETFLLTPGGFAFIPPGMTWSQRNHSGARVVFHWIRKAYEPVEDLGLPQPLVVNEADVKNIGDARHARAAGPRRGSSTIPTCGSTCT